MTRFRLLSAFLILMFPCACTGNEAGRTSSGTDVGNGNDAGQGEQRDAAVQPPANDAAPPDPAPSPVGEAGSGGTPGTGGGGGAPDVRGGMGGDAGARDAGASGSGGATTSVEDGGLASIGGQGGETGVDANAGSPTGPAPIECENYWDCPLTLSVSCEDDESVRASADVALGCVDGLCVHSPIGQSCSDSANCDGCLALGRAQDCRSETGDACTVCCYGIFDALLEHEIRPELDCACSTEARCAVSCGDSTICDGQVAPSLECLGCLREAFQPEGECSRPTDSTVGDEVCTNDVIDQGLGCGQFGVCMANCAP